MSAGASTQDNIHNSTTNIISAANSSVNTSSNNRDAPFSQTWSSLTTDAKRRWRQNRTAQRRYRQYKQDDVAASQFDDQPPELTYGMGSEMGPAVASVLPAGLSRSWHQDASLDLENSGDGGSGNMLLRAPTSHSGELVAILEFPAHAPEYPHLPTSLDGTLPPQGFEEDTESLGAPEANNSVANSYTRPGNIPRETVSPMPGDTLQNSQGQQQRQHKSQRLTRNGSAVTLNETTQYGATNTSNNNSIPVMAPLTRIAQSRLQSHTSRSPQDTHMHNNNIGSTGSTSTSNHTTTITTTNSSASSASSSSSRNNDATSIADRLGQSALHKSAARGHEAMTQLLLKEGGADVELPDDAGRRALHLAAAGGYLAVVQVLIEAGADLEVSDATGLRPLHVAVIHGHVDVARFLLWKGAQVDALDRSMAALNSTPT